MGKLSSVSRPILAAAVLVAAAPAKASIPGPSTHRSRHAPSPVAIGIRSAIAHGLPSLLEPEPALAFSGGKALPPARLPWHRQFFNRGRPAGPAASAGGGVGRREEGEAAAARLFGTRAGGGGSAAAAAAAVAALSPPGPPLRSLSFWESMVCGAVSRSVAHTVTHPANAMKTILQTSSSRGESVTLSSLVQPSKSNLRLLTRGAGAQFLLSVPQGAVNFAVLEYIRGRARELLVSRSDFGESLEKNGLVGASLDFLSSAASTVCCSVISTPVSMVTDNIMAGTYPDLRRAVAGIASERGLGAFYTGWWPNLCGKIPSYGLTWVCFQRLKDVHGNIFDRPPSDLENSAMGCLASGAVVCIMMPMDTIKTRIMTQALSPVSYNGMRDCAVRILNEEGLSAFYRGLTPRLLSVVPTVGIQFGVYECMKRICLERYTIPTQEAEREKRVIREKNTMGIKRLQKN